MKHFTLRISDEDYALFMQIASAEHSSLAGSFRRGMMRSAHLLGLRTVATSTNLVTHTPPAPYATATTTTRSSIVVKQKPALPAAAIAALDDLFETEGGATPAPDVDEDGWPTVSDE